uniref:Conserved+hypothetical+protein n=1 Tax=Oryza brachyantha TaxID=4533 RepID=G8JBA0_ORYBR|nr:conserved+hypothetical+protein [Oryza brachyantha]
MSPLAFTSLVVACVLLPTRCLRLSGYRQCATSAIKEEYKMTLALLACCSVVCHECTHRNRDACQLLATSGSEYWLPTRTKEARDLVCASSGIIVTPSLCERALHNGQIGWWCRMIGEYVSTGINKYRYVSLDSYTETWMIPISINMCQMISKDARRYQQYQHVSYHDTELLVIADRQQHVPGDDPVLLVITRRVPDEFKHLEEGIEEKGQTIRIRLGYLAAGS